MGGDVFVVVEHLGGKVAEVSVELLGKGRELAQMLGGGRLVAVVLGNDVKNVAAACGLADTVLCMEHETLAGFTPEAHAIALAALLRDQAARLILVGSTTKGMDIAPDLALELEAPVVTNVCDIKVENGSVTAVSQLYGGKVWAEVEVPAGRAVLSVLAGSFPAEKGKTERTASVEQVPAPAELGELRTSFRRLIEPEAADIDITKQEVLVSVGRGIQNKENIELVQELADLIGCPLSASRPIVDLGWLPKSRQVGKSGVTVKPKIYIAIGISGAPEHIQGMKDAGTIIAINTDPKAPIFDVAHYGVTADLFDVVPALTEKLRELKA